ncbi:hypothetical protein BJ912DRAFT_1098058 [Pholiota molesta]|nr:hypothetical protein BJ912DRAFT_1098058 [Pholiota molesta]
MDDVARACTTSPPLPATSCRDDAHHDARHVAPTTHHVVLRRRPWPATSPQPPPTTMDDARHVVPTSLCSLTRHDYGRSGVGMEGETRERETHQVRPLRPSPSLAANTHPLPTASFRGDEEPQPPPPVSLTFACPRRRWSLRAVTSPMTRQHAQTKPLRARSPRTFSPTSSSRRQRPLPPEVARRHRARGPTSAPQHTRSCDNDNASGPRCCATTMTTPADSTTMAVHQTVRAAPTAGGSASTVGA